MFFTYCSTTTAYCIILLTVHLTSTFEIPFGRSDTNHSSLLYNTYLHWTSTFEVLSRGYSGYFYSMPNIRYNFHKSVPLSNLCTPCPLKSLASTCVQGCIRTLHFCEWNVSMVKGINHGNLL
jgi:hypothetical protein